MAVSLGLQPDRALLNDINPHVINLYKQLQSGLHWTFEPVCNEETYYQRRQEFNTLIAEGQLGTSHGACLFLYLNKTCFNGLCRFNRKGEFNTPFGKYKSVNYRRDFEEFKDILREWEFCCSDFQALEINNNDFVYADPPYDDTFTDYSAGGFSWEDQERLALWLSNLSCPVIVSNSSSERVGLLYRRLGFRVEFLDSPRSISANGDRGRRGEFLAARNFWSTP